MNRLFALTLALTITCLPASAAGKAGRLSHSFVIRATEEVRSVVVTGQGTQFDDVPGFTDTFVLDHQATLLVQGNLVAAPLGGPMDLEVAVAFDGVPQVPAIVTHLEDESRLITFVDGGSLAPGRHTVSVQWRGVPVGDQPPPPDLCAQAFARRMVLMVY